MSDIRRIIKIILQEQVDLGIEKDVIISKDSDFEFYFRPTISFGRGRYNGWVKLRNGMRWHIVEDEDIVAYFYLLKKDTSKSDKIASELEDRDTNGVIFKTMKQDFALCSVSVIMKEILKYEPIDTLFDEIVDEFYEEEIKKANTLEKESIDRKYQSIYDEVYLDAFKRKVYRILSDSQLIKNKISQEISKASDFYDLFEIDYYEIIYEYGMSLIRDLIKKIVDLRL